MRRWYSSLAHFMKGGVYRDISKYYMRRMSIPLEKGGRADKAGNRYEIKGIIYE